MLIDEFGKDDGVLVLYDNVEILVQASFGQGRIEWVRSWVLQSKDIECIPLRHE